MHRNALFFALLAVFCLPVFFLSAKKQPFRVRNCLLLAFVVSFLSLTVSSFFSSEIGKIPDVFFQICFCLLLFVSAALLWSGAAMIRRESVSLVRCVPFFSGVLFAIGGAAGLILMRKGLLGPGIGSLFILSLLSWVSLLLISFLLYVLILPSFSRPEVFDAIIVHGCALIHGDQISRILAERLETALWLYHYGADKPLIVLSGGRGDDETITEAEAMRRYLCEQGVPDEHIVLEDRSHSTEENLHFSWKLLSKVPHSRLALVTSNYHLFRCLMQAHELSIPCKGFGSAVAAYYWPNAVIREFAAVFRRKRCLLGSMFGFLVFFVLLVGARHILGIL